MELDELRTALDAPVEQAELPTRPAGRGGSGFLEQLFARHGHSTQASSKQLLAVASALRELVESEGLEPTPTALFAACMSSLERQELGSSVQLLTPTCHLLDSLLPYVPNSVLRAKFALASSVLQPLVEAATARQSKGALALLARPALGAACQVLAAFDPADWRAAAPCFSLVLRLCSDARPKLRRRAQEGVVDALIAASARPAALAAASALVAAEAERLLAAPEAAARAAAAAAAKKQREAEDAIVAASAAALHLLGLLRRALPLLSTEAARGVARSALAMLPLHQPLLSRHAAEAVAQLYEAASGPLEPEARAASAPVAALSVGEALTHLRSLVGVELSVAERRDADCAAARARLPLLCLLRVHRLESEDGGAARTHTLEALPRVARFLLPLASAELDLVRGAALQALVVAVRETLDPATVRAGALLAAQSGKPTGLVAFVSALDAALSPAQRDAWPAAFRVASELFAALGRGPGAVLAEPLLRRLDGMCAGAQEAAEDGPLAVEPPSDELVMGAQACMGSALCTLGPRNVLEALPLGIMEALVLGEQGAARTWMLPLLRRHACAGEAAYWREELLPLAQKLGQMGAEAARLRKEQEATMCLTLEAQIWTCLPSFLNWAEDAGATWKALHEPLAAAFKRSDQYQTIVCNGLSTICLNMLSFYNRAGQPLGYAAAGSLFKAEEEASAAEAGIVEDEDDAATGFASTVQTARTALTTASLAAVGGAAAPGKAPGPHSRSGAPPAHYDAATADANLAELRTASALWLPALLDGFLGTSSSHQGLLHSTLALLARVCEPSAVARAFKAVGSQAVKAAGRGPTSEDGPSDSSARGALLELALALAAGLDARGLAPLVRLARPLLAERDAALQKKAYKVMAYVCSGQRGDYAEDPAARALLLELVIDNQDAAVSPARRYRLRAVKWAVLELLLGAPGAARTEESMATIGALVGEIVLSLKEVNAKTRAMGFATLVELARALHEARPPTRGLADAMELGGEAVPVLTSMGGLSELITVVLGGLVGATPHMISASVLALARLLHEFSALLLGLVPDLLPAVLSLFRSRAREVIKSGLGFVKVVVSRLPPAELAPRVPDIVRAILLWAEDTKNKFRLRVRVILERLVRRCGLDVVEPAVPETHRGLITHIRKDLSRQDRRRGASEAGDDARSRRTRAEGPPGSAWEARSVATAADAKSKRSAARTERAAARSERAAAARAERGAARAAGADGADEPMDLRDAAAGRELMRAAAAAGARRRAGSDGEDDFPRDDTGRLVVRDPEAPRKRARGASEFFDSDDSDFEDLKGYSGIDLALKGAQSVARAPTIAASIGGRSLARSARTARTAASSKSRKSQHTGERFKSARAGGDLKKGKLEPYAYWPLDRRLMNRRPSKARAAKEGLKDVVNRKAGKRPAKRVKRDD